mmetsp:Transcript_11092/g.18833  ORF Transcript_11092/g.18833 Transcript_11092/m.18833 type:complete len:82 (-) Transcript_11092:1001-1246(-)
MAAAPFWLSAQVTVLLLENTKKLGVKTYVDKGCKEDVWGNHPSMKLTERIETAAFLLWLTSGQLRQEGLITSSFVKELWLC